MIIRGMEFPVPLIVICILIVFALIIFPLFMSYKAEKKDKLSEWDKIKEFGNKINDETRKKH
tara:strand:+ start:142 stop:327 length:186 start_codon:yes stop_codon:yes gene_type:complete